MKSIAKYIINYFKKTDNILVLLCLSASVFSVMLLLGIDNSGMLRSTRQIYVQIIASAVGLTAAIVMSKIDYHIIAKIWKFHSLVAYGLVLLTFVTGITIGKDDKAWLQLPFGLTLQPSEFLKISFIVTFALHLEKVSGHLNNFKTLLGVLIHGGTTVGLIMLQGDHGTALIFIFILLSMLFSAGISWGYIFAAGGAGACLFPVIWQFLDDEKRMRILTVFNPMLDPQGISWQQNTGMMSIGSGQIWGTGLFAGKHNYVSEIYNDLIFTFAGEALGFVGCMAILFLLSSISLKIICTSLKSRDLLGKYICVGVFAMFAFQVLLNIGMCIRVLPVIGITLPFFSAGGTSVVASYMGIGLVLSVYIHNNSKGMFGEKL